YRNSLIRRHRKSAVADLRALLLPISGKPEIGVGPPPRAGGEWDDTRTWRNGRRKGLKIPWEISREGSSPSVRTSRLQHLCHCKIVGVTNGEARARHFCCRGVAETRAVTFGTVVGETRLQIKLMQSVESQETIHVSARGRRKRGW